MCELTSLSARLLVGFSQVLVSTLLLQRAGRWKQERSYNNNYGDDDEDNDNGKGWCRTITAATIIAVMTMRVNARHTIAY